MWRRAGRAEHALAGIIGGLLLGALATRYSTRAALVAAGLILCPALLLYARAARREKPPEKSIALGEDLPAAPP